MKKLLALLLLSPLANASSEMDYVCNINQLFFEPEMVAIEITEKGCVRNMILNYEVVVVPERQKDNKNPRGSQTQLLMLSNNWCRFDRNRDFSDKSFSCVLYSDEPREDSSKY